MSDYSIMINLSKDDKSVIGTLLDKDSTEVDSVICNLNEDMDEYIYGGGTEWRSSLLRKLRAMSSEGNLMDLNKNKTYFNWRRIIMKTNTHREFEGDVLNKVDVGGYNNTRVMIRGVSDSIGGGNFKDGKFYAFSRVDGFLLRPLAIGISTTMSSSLGEDERIFVLDVHEDSLNALEISKDYIVVHSEKFIGYEQISDTLKAIVNDYNNDSIKLKGLVVMGMNYLSDSHNDDILDMMITENVPVIGFMYTADVMSNMHLYENAYFWGHITLNNHKPFTMDINRIKNRFPNDLSKEVSSVTCHMSDGEPHILFDDYGGSLKTMFGVIASSLK